MKYLNRIALVLFFMFFSCDVEDVGELCGKSAVINNTLYSVTSTSNYTITNAIITGNCITITVSSSGCNGNTWKGTLIDANQIAESNPEQRNVKLLLETNEICLAIVTKEFSFDIGNLQTTNSSIILNLDTWNQQLIYNY